MEKEKKVVALILDKEFRQNLLKVIRAGLTEDIDEGLRLRLEQWIDDHSWT